MQAMMVNMSAHDLASICGELKCEYEIFKHWPMLDHDAIPHSRCWNGLVHRDTPYKKDVSTLTMILPSDSNSFDVITLPHRYSSLGAMQEGNLN